MAASSGELPRVPCSASTSAAFLKAATSCIAPNSHWSDVQSPPDAAAISAICKRDSLTCRGNVDGLRATAPNECVLSQGYYLYKDFVTPVTEQCGVATTSLSNTSSLLPAAIECPAKLQETLIKDADRCSEDAGYSLSQITAPLAASQYALFCQSKACKTLVDAMRIIAPDECVTNDELFLYADILQPIMNQCGWKASSPLTETPFPSNNTTATSPASDSKTGPSIGIALGCVGFVVITILLCVWIRRRRTASQKKRSGDDDGVSSAIAAYTSMEAEHQHLGEKHEIQGVARATPSHELLDYRSFDLHPTLIPLLQAEDIVAARLPVSKIQRGERVSSGSFCELYRGHYKSNVVAVKMLLRQNREDVFSLKRFLEEIKIAASIEHERIVQFIGVAWESVPDICAVYEFMDGGDLRTLLTQYEAENKPRGLDKSKVKIALHVAHALTYMHSLQPPVLHGELKSRNIMLDSQLNAKVAECSVSLFQRAESMKTESDETSLWLAPEVLKGEEYDEKADVFSFGVILSELDTNLPPYATQVDLSLVSFTKPRRVGHWLARQAKSWPDELNLYDEIVERVALGSLAVEFSANSHPDLVALGRECVDVDPARRPSASEVLYRVDKVWRE